jgi:hypothetical protein
VRALSAVCQLAVGDALAEVGGVRHVAVNRGTGELEIVGNVSSAAVLRALENARASVEAARQGHERDFPSCACVDEPSLLVTSAHA